nr:immunoglobulin light chain junction region [Macaca mulatta]
DYYCSAWDSNLSVLF